MTELDKELLTEPDTETTIDIEKTTVEGSDNELDIEKTVLKNCSSNKNNTLIMEKDQRDKT